MRVNPPPAYATKLRIARHRWGAGRGGTVRTGRDLPGLGSTCRLVARLTCILNVVGDALLVVGRALGSRNRRRSGRAFDEKTDDDRDRYRGNAYDDRSWKLFFHGFVNGETAREKPGR